MGVLPKAAARVHGEALAGADQACLEALPLMPEGGYGFSPIGRVSFRAKTSITRNYVKTRARH